jgi:hypothetical protein
MITMNSNKSGLQKQVLSLYRKLLRNAYAKDCKNEINSIAKAFSDVNSSTFALREKFRKKATSVSKRDIERIEHNIRVGEKYVKQLNMKGVVGFKRA